ALFRAHVPRGRHRLPERRDLRRDLSEVATDGEAEQPGGRDHSECDDAHRDGVLAHRLARLVPNPLDPSVCAHRHLLRRWWALRAEGPPGPSPYVALLRMSVTAPNLFVIAVASSPSARTTPSVITARTTPSSPLACPSSRCAAARSKLNQDRRSI